MKNLKQSSQLMYYVETRNSSSYVNWNGEQVTEQDYFETEAAAEEAAFFYNQAYSNDGSILTSIQETILHKD